MSALKFFRKGVPVNPLEVFKEGKYFDEQRAKRLHVNLVIDALADDDIIGDTRMLLVPQTNNAIVKTRVLVEDEREMAPQGATFTVIVLGEEILEPSAAQRAHALKKLIDRMERHKQPCAIVTKSEKVVSLAALLDTSVQNIISVESYEALAAKLALWCAENMPEERLALAANFEFVRHSVALEFVKATALQNGVVGGVVFIPGADMPIMTLNQIKMVLQIAAAYGEPMNMARVKELATVVAGAFVSRTIARELVAFIPGVGWAIKAGIGYGATYAMGLAVVEYFSMGGNEISFGDFIKGAKDDIIDKAHDIAEKHMSEDEATTKPQRRAETAHSVAHFARSSAKEVKRLYIESKGTRDNA